MAVETHGKALPRWNLDRTERTIDITTDLMPDGLAEVLPSIEAARLDKTPVAHARYSSADCKWCVLGYDPATDTALCLFMADQTIESWPIGELEDLACSRPETRFGR
jgi:hypothetical protein